MHWAPDQPLTLVGNRVSPSSPLQPNKAITFVNSVAVAPESGKVYFTASTDIPPPFQRDGYYGTMRSAYLTAMTVRTHDCAWRRSSSDGGAQAVHHWCFGYGQQLHGHRPRWSMQGSKTGMLLEYDPATGTTTCLVDGIWFSNGVALGEDGPYVVFVETFTLRVWKLWLEGPKVQRCSTLCQHCHAFPAWRLTGGFELTRVASEVRRRLAQQTAPLIVG
jgi:Strictosidine synthase